MKSNITEKQLSQYIKYLESSRQDLVAQICVANASINRCKARRHRLKLEKAIIIKHLLNDQSEIPLFDSFRTPEYPKVTLDLVTFVTVVENDPLFEHGFDHYEDLSISSELIEDTIRRARVAIESDTGVYQKELATKLRDLRSQLSAENKSLEKARSKAVGQFNLRKVFSAKGDEKLDAINERILALTNQIETLQSRYSELVEKKKSGQSKIVNWRNAQENLKNHESQLLKCAEEIARLGQSIEEVVDEYEKVSKLIASPMDGDYAIEWLAAERMRKETLRIEKIKDKQREFKEIEKVKESERKKKIRSLRNNQKRLASLRSELSGTDLIKLRKQIDVQVLNLDKQKALIEQYKEDIKIKLLQISKSKNPTLRTRNGLYVRASDCDLESVFSIIDLPSTPSLHNLCIRLERGRADLAKIESEFKKLRERVSDFESKSVEVVKLEKLIRSDERALNVKGAKRGDPPTAEIENWEDAEEFAEVYMRWLGFSDARKTAAGADLGKDIESSGAVAQVKDMGTGVTRPMVQQLFGVASAEKKIPVFFARSYARTAIDWSTEHGVALFQFNLRGEVKGITERAHSLIRG